MPIARGTKKSDKTRKYQNEYDSKNYKVAACKIKIEDYAKFQDYADSQGKSVSALLSEYIRRCIAD